jgi:probable O-glycosylation ligase (exosortase A-associated)
MEKQTIFMAVVTAGAILGSLGWGPYVGIVVYYAFAVLRPQSLWEYALPNGVQWSLYVALGVIAAAAVNRLRLIGYATTGPTPGAKVGLWNPIHWLMMAFCLWMTVSYMRAENQERSWPVYDIYLKTALMFVITSLTVYRLRQFWVLLAVLVAMDVWVAYEANYKYFAWRLNTIQRDGFGGLDNNGAALMLAMAIPLGYFLWEGTRGWWRWGYLLVLPVLAHAVQLTFSRGAMLSTLCTLPFLFLFSRNKRLLAVFAVLGAAFVFATSGQELKERFFSIKQHDVDESANMRKRAWKAAVEIANESPFYGVGIRCSAPHMEEHGATPMMAIHNQYLQLAADTGWVGMGVYIALYGSAVVFGFRLWWKIRKWPDFPEVRQARAMAAGITCALILYGIGAAFLSLDTFELPYVLFLLMAQLWNCYKGGGIEAAVRANGSVLPAPPGNLLPPRPRPRAAAMPPPRAVVPAAADTPVVPLTPARPN